ncbi:MAG TPA: aldo/keto reductase [Bryobacteraceae bacterium]|nr:aldo/keto reductase [Bryobacteraceae bacterium]
MKYRTLGRTGFSISELGYGAWGIGGKQWLGGNDDESVRALHRAMELGVNFIDTALAYGDGHSEKLVGRVIRDAKHRMFVATKVPPKNRLWPAKPGVGIEQVFPYEYIIRCTDESLHNLKVDTIDLQQLHVWNPEWFHRDEWRRAFEELKTAGKVRAVGVSINDHQPDSALELVQSGLIDTVQVIYNVFDQTPEKNLFPLAQKMNVGVLARVPFDEGSLTGSVTERTVFDPKEFRAFYFRGDRKGEVVKHVTALQNDLAGIDGSLAEIALRFIISHPAVSSSIPGMRSVKNVERNAAAADTGSLDDATIQVLKRHSWDKNYYW